MSASYLLQYIYALPTHWYYFVTVKVNFSVNSHRCMAVFPGFHAARPRLWYFAWRATCREVSLHNSRPLHRQTYQVFDRLQSHTEIAD